MADASAFDGRIKPVKVTISCPETGEVLEERVVDNDYMLITAGKRCLKWIHVQGRTHILSVAWQEQE